jgi:DNA (cytosine-5)-methyltransferase 1
MLKKLTFIDFCAGIGAGRLGLENNGLECLGFSEINKIAEKTYRLFFGTEEQNFGDLTKIIPEQLPNFDFLIAGFPCQTFSVIGQRKGMEDERGQIIFHLIDILKKKKVKYFLLENVKGLVNHDNGNSFKVILRALDEAGYQTSFKVLNSLDYGVPQMRERIYFVGFKKDLLTENFVFDFPKPLGKIPELDQYLVDEEQLTTLEKVQSYKTFLRYLGNSYNLNRHSINDLLSQENLVLDTRQSDLRLYKKRVPTLRLGRHGILYVKNKKFRKLSGYEALLLQGFPKELASKAKSGESDINLLKLAGNAMTVSTIEHIVKQMLQSIKNLENQNIWQTYKQEDQLPQEMDLEMKILL